MSYLLFFDTFAHDGNEPPSKLDLVQFPKPVQVSEIRVIPLGARVQADFPGGFRLGATNPSQFEIDFFVNDLGKRGAASFEKVGQLQYQQTGLINLKFDKEPPTDGLLLRGCYNTITLAVYGCLGKVNRDPPQAVPPPLSPPQQTVEAESQQSPASKREAVVINPPSVSSLPHHALPEKVNPNERIRDWLQDTQVPHSPLDLESSPKVWVDQDEPSYDSDVQQNVGFAKEPPVSLAREVPPSPPGSPPQSPSPVPNRRSISSPMGRSKSSRDRSSTKGGSRSRDGKHDRSKEKNQDDDRAAKKAKEKSTRHRSRERSRDASQHRSYTASDDRRDKDGSKKRSRDSRRSDRREHRRRSSDSYDRRKSYGSDCGPKTPPPPHWREQNEEESKSSKRQRVSEEKRKSSTAESKSEQPVLFNKEEMEEISDDESLPDVPPKETDTAKTGERTDREEKKTETKGKEIVVPQLDFEEIMSDEEELPEYQMFEEESEMEAVANEEEYIVEEWEVWAKPQLSLSDVFVSVPPLVHLTNTERPKRDPFSPEAKADLTSKVSALTLPSPASSDEDKESFVCLLETIVLLIPSALSTDEGVTTDEDATVERLCQCMVVGLDMTVAMSQPQPVYKIRHLKAGLRLVIALCRQSDTVTAQCVKSLPLIDTLVTLFRTDHMAQSIKLLILRCMDSMLCTSMGIKLFLSEQPVICKTGYEVTLLLLASTTHTRVKVCAAAILRKVNFLEVVKKLNSDVMELHTLIKNSPITSSPDSSDKLDKSETAADEVCESEVSSLPVMVSITSCLKSTLHTVLHSDQLLSQCQSYLPVMAQFEVPSLRHSVVQELLILLSEGELLSSAAQLLTLLTLGIETTDDSEMKAFFLEISCLLLQILSALVSRGEGLTYLAANEKQTTQLIKALMQMPSEYSDSCAIHQNFMSCDESCLNPKTFSSSLIEKLHAVHQLDAMALLSLAPEIDLEQLIIHLRSLSGMMMNKQSKDSLMTVLTSGDFMSILLPCCHLLTDVDDADSNPLKLSASGYAIEMLSASVKLKGDAHFLKKYATKINTLVEKESQRSNATVPEDSAKLMQLTPYLSVALKQDLMSYDHINQLVDIVKNNLDKVVSYPGEMFTALRMMKYLAIPQHQCTEEDKREDVIEELKYKYAVVQLCYYDLISHLNSLLNNICSHYPQPAIYCHIFNGADGQLILALLEPALSLLYCLLEKIISTRGASYHDPTSVNPLISTYHLLCYFHGDVKAVTLQRKIVKSLLLYTLPGQNKDTPCSAHSLWSQMLQLVIKSVGVSPQAAVPSLCLLTELLPLPLPLQITRRVTSATSRERLLAERQLWAANVAPVGEHLYLLIKNIAPGTAPALSYSFRRCCVSLADLAPQTSELIMRPLLDMVLEAQKTESDCSQVLYTLASLLSHSGLKVALLYSVTNNDNYGNLLSYWSNCEDKVLQTHSSPLILMFYNLCDVYNTMNSEKVVSGNEMHGVPSKELMSPISECIARLLSMGYVLQYEDLSHLLHTVSNLLLHDYGINLLKQSFEKHKTSLKPVILKIRNDLQFSSNPDVCVESLEGLIEVIQSLLKVNNSDLEMRKCVMNSSEVSVLLDWKKAETEKDSEEKIPNAEADGRTLFSGMVFENLTIPDDKIWKYYKEVEDLAELLDCDTEESESSDSSVFIGVAGYSLSGSFEDRSVYSESPHCSLWLDNPPILYGGEGKKDGSSTDDRLFSVNLHDLVKKFCAPDFDLESSVRKLLSGRQQSHGSTPQKLALTTNSGGAMTQRHGGRGGINSNGGMGRGGANGRGGRSYGYDRRGTNLRSDPFRCRPPNTSRPPSLHVDDFVALESTGHQPTGPTGYNRISFGRGKMLLDSMRGGRGSRGGMRGSDDMRGGFMYGRSYRPEFGRGMRGNRWNNFRGGPDGGFRPPGSMRFMRGRGSYRGDRGMMRGLRQQFH